MEGVDPSTNTILHTHRVVDDFVLAKQLYKGKASVLFQATCRRSTTTVALKLYRKHKLSQLNWFQVEREIRIHSQLDHPNIIKLYGAFEDGKHVYLVQEYAAGGDLYQELKRSGGRFSEAYAAANLLQPFLHAVSYLHDRGVIHRDIKPENILLTETKAVKLADFGLSICWTQERPVTRAGTLDYMAPEVLLCPEKTRPEENKDKLLLGYSSLVDCWAAGVLAYELLTGRPPFEQDTREATCEHIMYHKAPHPPWMPEDARAFISTALSKAPRKRPGVQDLLHHPWILRHLQAAVQSAATPTTAPIRSPDEAASTVPATAVNAKGPQTPTHKAVEEHAAAAVVQLQVTASAPANTEEAGQGLEEPPGGLRVFLRTASNTVKHLLHNPVGALRSIMEPETCSRRGVASPTSSSAQELPGTTHGTALHAAPTPQSAPVRSPAEPNVPGPVHVVADTQSPPKGPVIPTSTSAGNDKAGGKAHGAAWNRSVSSVSSGGSRLVVLPQLVAESTKPTTQSKARRGSPQRSPSIKAVHGGASGGGLRPKTAGPLPAAVALQIAPREGTRGGQRGEDGGRLRRGMSSSTSAPALRELDGERSHKDSF